MYEKNFDVWNSIKIKTDTSHPSTRIREGEVRWCRYGMNIGNEIVGKGNTFRRPVLILKKYSGDVFLGLPLTTKVKNGNWYYKITHDGVDQCVILNQARTFDRKRLEDKLFELSEKELAKIKEAFCELVSH